MTNTQTIADHIRELEARRFDAIVAEDFDTFAELCDERLSYTHSNGVRDTLETYIIACRTGYYDYHHVEHPIDDVLVLGDVVIVHGRMRADLTVSGTRTNLHTQSMAVWVRSDEQWRLLAFQGTSIPTNGRG